MDIQGYIELIKEDPKSFHIIGKGGRCLALVHRNNPKEVLLLESAKDTASGNAGESHRPDRAHARSITFARMYDRHLDAGLTEVRNWRKRPYIHSTLLAEVSPEKLGNPIALHIGNGKVFMGYSARLIKRIPGYALHYMDFVDDKNPLSSRQVRGIAEDVAQWMFTLHHEVSTGAMVANKVEKQFADAGRVLTDGVTNSEKYKLFVTSNLREINILRENLKNGTMVAEHARQMEKNMEIAGVDFNLLAQVADCLAKRLEKILVLDRVGLTHSDIHPANLIVNSRRDCLHGVCDWMTGVITAQSVDFAGLGIARGLLPKVVRAYRRLENQRRVDKQVNVEAIYAFAAMRQLFVTVKSLKHGHSEGAAARVAWEQVQESVVELGKLYPNLYVDLSRKMRRLDLPTLRLPASRNALASRPSGAACG